MQIYRKLETTLFRVSIVPTLVYSLVQTPDQYNKVILKLTTFLSVRLNERKVDSHTVFETTMIRKPLSLDQ